ncbi:MAG: hypothetical protein V4591_04510 [Bdellovibrionota bacterium]
MEENEFSQLEERKQELETTLKNLAELMESRNLLLSFCEKNSLRKIVSGMFSNLRINARGDMIFKLDLINKSHQLDLKMLRRGQFFLCKRKSRLEEELNEVNEKIKNFQADSTSLSQSA